ncbi:response regulator [Paenibacillus sp. GCM10012306]|uniref:response regulator n=1 Tax=Paenibacillus sp. GCM10012306 TaxID=3317342 RepID=UPI0036068065
MIVSTKEGNDEMAEERTDLFTAVIVEDEKPILELMKVVVGRNHHCHIIGAFSNPMDALTSLPKLQPDIVFLDVEMPRLSGLELARRIDECCENTRIVFTTAYKEYALEAFNVFAFDYILKPVTPAAIARITDRLIKEAGRSASSKAMSAPMPQAFIRCFGGFEVRNPKGELIHWPARKTEELFAYLLCYPNQDSNKWHLMNVLWPDMDEERAAHNLHNTVYRLRKLLKEQDIGMNIVKTGDGYFLETLQASYDLLELQRSSPALADAPEDIASLERLCDLYRGSLLDRKDYLWKVRLEEGCAKQYKVLLYKLVRHQMTRKDWTQAQQRLEAGLSVCPLEEDMHLLLLEVYAASGKRDRVIKHYASFEEQYRRELGLGPSQEMKRWVDAYLTR